MARHLLPEIAAFVRVHETGSFAAAAQDDGRTASGLSRMVSRLEDALGVRLMHRSTRRLFLTSEGERFLDHAYSVLATLEAAQAELSEATGETSGTLRVNCGSAFAHHRLAPMLPAFLAAHPKVRVEIAVSDRRVDVLDERVDVAIRVGRLEDSDLHAVPLGTVRRVIAASPDYLMRRGTPQTPQDLKQHDCLLLAGFPHQTRWPMLEDGRPLIVSVSGPVVSDTAETLLRLAEAGAGIVRLGDFLGADALEARRLVPLLVNVHDDDPSPITALIPPGQTALPRVRAFIAFLKDVVAKREGSGKSGATLKRASS
ncbi:LysR family transcriptional regulator [uncultured Tateyamaria sp.]|uniref:LysR family transcriptional regulator n=1 Tax=uncultured Tateyamaria sp. TaxID=455651 RepID=UPI002616CC5B|nr:LysR family transcriptional regulator [uncultured Tateyamaria sp.]